MLNILYLQLNSTFYPICNIINMYFKCFKYFNYFTLQYISKQHVRFYNTLHNIVSVS